MKRIVKLFRKKEIFFHQPGSWRENFSSDTTVRIFIGLSAVLRIVRWSINLRRDISSIDIDEPVRKIKNTPMFAKQMVSAPEVTWAPPHVFSVLDVLSIRRIRTLITLCVRRCITHVKPLHTRTLYATENAAQDILRKHVAMYE